MSAVLLRIVSPQETAMSSCSSLPSTSNPLLKFIQRGQGRRRKNCIPCMSYSHGLTILSTAVAHPFRSSEEKVYDVVLKQAALVKEQRRRMVDSRTSYSDLMGNSNQLNDAYDRCGEVCAEYAKTFYLGNFAFPGNPGLKMGFVPFMSVLKMHVECADTVSVYYIGGIFTGWLWDGPWQSRKAKKARTLLMTPQRQRAVWSIYVWCRRTDELVDGPNASHITPTALDQWEERLNGLFEGRPYDMFDAALSDTVSKFPVDIQPFKDMIEGMRLDMRKSRYENFDELYLYCYYVAGTVGLMSVPVMGIAADSMASTESVYNAALALGIANQLTNILRDVGEDARRGRIYLPQDELAAAGLSEDDIFLGKVTDKWRNFMKGQIKRARMFFDEAEKGVSELNSASRWPVWASLMLYRQILDAIEANDYNNFTKRAYVGKGKKIASLPIAYARALMGPSKSPTLLRT
ncbi:hypothetical protein ACLOJK_021546 [Asimina triloba]